MGACVSIQQSHDAVWSTFLFVVFVVRRCGTWLNLGGGRLLQVDFHRILVCGVPCVTNQLAADGGGVTLVGHADRALLCRQWCLVECRTRPHAACTVAAFVCSGSWRQARAIWEASSYLARRLQAPGGHPRPVGCLALWWQLLCQQICFGCCDCVAML
jgi:hypothetical protein